MLSWDARVAQAQQDSPEDATRAVSAQGLRVAVGQLVRGGYTTEMRPIWCLIPPEMEVPGNGARRAGETDVDRNGNSCVVLEDGGGVRLVAAADDVS